MRGGHGADVFAFTAGDGNEAEAGFLSPAFPCLVVGAVGVKDKVFCSRDGRLDARGGT